jgi:hypothetical protein
MVAPALLCALVVIRVTSRSRGPRLLSSVTRAKSSLKQPTKNCMLCALGFLTPKALHVAGSAAVLFMPLVLGITRVVLWLKRVFPMVTVKMNSSLWPQCFSYAGKLSCKTGRFYTCFYALWMRETNFQPLVELCHCLVTEQNWTEPNEATFVMCKRNWYGIGSATYHTRIFFLTLL